MAEPLTRPGGIVQWDLGEKISSSDLERMGNIARQGLYGVLARLLKDEVVGDERSGFFGAADCLVSVSSGLTLSVAPGMGVYDDEADTDAFGPVLKPIVVSAAYEPTLDAHEANPRYDIVCLAPSTTDDTSETRSVIDPSDASVSTQAVYKRRRDTYAVQVVKGTAAVTPSVPATPSGYLKIAEVLVPATSGAVTITDTRVLLQASEALARYTPPAREYHCNFVPGTGSECAVTGSLAALQVTVADGVVHVNESRRQIRSQIVTLATADATNPRYDIIVAYDDGTVNDVTGTPAATPTVPSTPSNAALLAVVSVPATATVTAPNRVTDARVRTPVAKDQLAVAYPTATVGSESSDAISVTIQVTAGPNGGALLRTVRLHCELLDGRGHAVDGSTAYRIALGASGTSATPGNSPTFSSAVSSFVLDTNGLGQAQVTATDLVTGVNRGCWLKITPINEPGTPVLVSLPFN